MSGLIINPYASPAEMKKKFGDLMMHFSQEITGQMPAGVSFALVAFTRDGGKYMGYVSPSPKLIVCSSLRAAADRIEKKKFFEADNMQIVLT